MIRVVIVGLGAATRHVHLPAYERFKHRLHYDKVWLRCCGCKKLLLLLLLLTPGRLILLAHSLPVLRDLGPRCFFEFPRYVHGHQIATPFEHTIFGVR